MTSQVMDVRRPSILDGGMTQTLSPRSVLAGHPATTTERRLRLVFRANAATSVITGLAMAAAPGTVDELLGSGHPGWIRIVGFGLLVFAAAVVWLSFADLHQLQRYAPEIVAADVSWVVASIVTCLLGWYSTRGVVAVGVMAVGVDVFAGLQFVLWRRLRG